MKISPQTPVTGYLPDTTRMATLCVFYHRIKYDLIHHNQVDRQRLIGNFHGCSILRWPCPHECPVCELFPAASIAGALRGLLPRFLNDQPILSDLFVFLLVSIVPNATAADVAASTVYNRPFPDIIS